MSDTDITRLNIQVLRLGRLAVLQSSAIMKLSAAILKMEGIDDGLRDDVFQVFSGLQEHIDVLNELNVLSEQDGE